MVDERQDPCTKCGKMSYLLTCGKGGYYCNDCYDDKIHNRWVYPKNPKFNGNACIGPDGINIYDHIGDGGDIDWIDIRKQKLRNAGGKDVDAVQIIKLDQGWVIRKPSWFGWYVYAQYDVCSYYCWGFIGKTYFPSYKDALETSLNHGELY